MNPLGTSLGYVSLPKLNNSKYDKWSIHMRALMGAQDLKAWKEKRMKDQAALYLLFQLVDESGFEKIAEAATSKEAWEMLEKVYKGDDRVKQVRLQALRSKLEAMKIKEIESVYDYITRVQTVNVVCAIEESKNIEDMAIDDLAGSLEAREQRKMNKKQESFDDHVLQTNVTVGEEAMYVYRDEHGRERNKHGRERNEQGRERNYGRHGFGRSGGGGRGYDHGTKSYSYDCYNCGKLGHYAKNCRFPKMVEDGANNFYNSGKSGHYARDCILPKRVVENTNLIIEEDKVDGIVMMAYEEVVEEEALMAYVDVIVIDAQWYLDTTARNHIIWNNMFSHIGKQAHTGDEYHVPTLNTMLEGCLQSVQNVMVNRGLKVKHEGGDVKQTSYERGEGSNSLSNQIDGDMDVDANMRVNKENKYDEDLLECEKVKEVKETMDKDFMMADLGLNHMLEMKARETVNNYLGRVMVIANDMQNAGEDISDVKIVEKVQRTMPERFNFVTILVMDVEEVEAKDTQIEEEGVVEEDHNFFKDQDIFPKSRPRNCLPGSFPQRVSEDKHDKESFWFLDSACSNHMTGIKEWFIRLDETYRHKIRLGNGHILEVKGKGDVRLAVNDITQLGHFQYECSNDARLANYAKFKDNEEILLMATIDVEGYEKETERLMVAVSEDKHDKESFWFLDSACSNHMTGIKEWFIRLDETYRHKIRLGNGHILEVKGKGDVRLAVNDITQVITNVYYVPLLTSNLISVGQLQEKSLTFVIQGGGCMEAAFSKTKTSFQSLDLEIAYPGRFPNEMAMLSIKVHRFEKKHGQKINFNGRENARIKIESDADLEGEVVSANDAIPGGVFVSAGNVVAAVVSPQSETEFALMGLSTE
nr:hypothetical protein [Tanacetum cinerariifolium]